MRSEFATGIQRVVRNIVREAELVGPAMGHECINVRFNGYGFEVDNLNDQKQLPGLGARIFARGTKYYRLTKRFVPALLHRLVLKIVTIALRLHQRRSPPLHTINLAIEKHAALHRGMGSASKPILLLLDSTWNMQIWRAVDTFRRNGGHVSAVLYDLIPFTHPETVEGHTRFLHTNWWNEAPLHLDSVICISKTVRTQFLDWQNSLPHGFRLAPANLDYFYLGSDLRHIKRDAAALANSVNYGLYFLVVGSIEPRKNHKTILDAFEILWAAQCPANLVIVGSHGWMSEAFLERVKNHPLRGKRLFLLRRTSDDELAALYEKALGLIIASIAEGFGLPIVEAFKHGTSVICSDIEVFHEIAGQSAIYFGATDPNDLARKLRDVYDTPSQIRKQLSSVPGTALSWEQSTSMLLSKFVDITQT